MALMDIEMDTRDISTPTFSKNQGARSPAIMAILKENKGILEKILNRKKEWIHDKDDKERNALHYAASKGYLYGVEYLLHKCDTCNMETDRYGFYPLHLASACGHIEVVKKLLENCPNPREIIDKQGRNIVHIAAIMGKFDVVRYVLHDANRVKDMINDKDYDGNTPLHLAASHYRPKIVQALTWDTSVDLNWLNNNHQTPLDAFEQFKQQDNPPIVQANFYLQRLTWCQLKSAGVQNAERGSHSIQVPSSPFKPKAKNTEFYKDRINTLMVVSTLITTVAFTGGFTLPESSNVIMRYISFYPFQFLTWLTEKDSIEGIFTLHDFDTDTKELEEHENGGKQTEETEEHEYGGKQTEETEETEEVDEGENEKDDNDNAEHEDNNDNVEDKEDNEDEDKDTHK
ncbi:uncharacterized protein HKW66_Vig0208280 [Vigna angularis]|uniref:PGG domain-containing protein n=1 Tax=Phaseolus angularis TaxID=3914 RepID=A0A8T0JK43_PHAAN|nr:uncharacterized protein HKW66_Vig0208280 [Vigna angularis]